MNRTRRLTGLIAATAFVVTVPMVATGADTTVDTDFFGDAGSLVIATGDEELTVTRFDTDGTEVDSEPVVLSKKAKCEIDASAFARLLGLGIVDATDAPLDVGLVSNGIGSRETNNCGTGNGQVEIGQTLRLTMPPGTTATSLQLDVEGKFGAALSMRGERNGAEVFTASGIPLQGESSDNGADAGDRDNTKVTDEDVVGFDPFDVLELTVASDDSRGAIALEGGGDYATPAERELNRTVFTLANYFEYSLDCGDTVTDVGDPDFGDTESGAEAYSLTRYANTDTGEIDPEGCDPIGADLSSDGDGVLFRKTSTDAEGDEQDPTTRLMLTWRVELYAPGPDEVLGTSDDVLRPQAQVEEELAREIDLLDGAGFKPVQYCTANNDAGDVLRQASRPTIIDSTDLDGDGDTTDEVDLPWCLLDETITVVDGYLLQVHEYDGTIDPRWQ